MENRPIYKSNGFYFGFIRNGHLYSRDGIPQGWVEGNFVWDFVGRFRGSITDINGNLYILVNRFALLPAQRPARPLPGIEIPPASSSNISPIALPVEVVDGF